MRQLFVGLLAGFAILWGTADASAQLFRPKCAPVVPLCPPTDPLTPPNTGTTPGTPNMGEMAQQVPPNALENAFAQSGESGGTAPRAFNDTFNGDFCGTFITRRIAAPPLLVPNPNTGPGQPVDILIPQTRVVVTASTNRYNGQLITDNDGPRPQDRAYFGYNYYNGIGTSLRQGLDRVDMFRETAGFEKTLFDGNASIGMRLPFVQLSGPEGIATANAGDIAIIGKYAFYNNRQTGDVASVGLQLSLPTGTGNPDLGDGSQITQSVLFQPFLGGVKMFERGYAQGITSIVAPTDNRDPLLFNNSVGVGYYLYQNAFDRFVNAVIPSCEVHVRTPLNHRNVDEPIFFQDQCNITTGVHFRTMRATVSPAICIPLLNKQAYNSEFSLAMNVKF